MAGSAGVTVASQLASWRSRRGVGLDITALPDMQLLSAKVGRKYVGFALANFELLSGKYTLCFKPVMCRRVGLWRLAHKAAPLAMWQCCERREPSEHHCNALQQQ